VALQRAVVMNLARMAVAQRRAQRPSTGLMKPDSRPAPIGGWVSAQNLAAMAPGTCLQLINARPTTTGISIRGGNSLHATINDDVDPEPVESGFPYIGATVRQFFMASDGNIFNVTTVADPEVVPDPVVTGQTSNYYAAVNFPVSGGYYLYAVNGTDPALLYDGTNFVPVGATAVYALDYDAETAPFTVGETVTGGTSGATGVIIKIMGTSPTGTLWINTLTGNFQDNEVITDGLGGSADADGTETILAGAVTGTSTSTWSHVNVYRNRLYFVRKGSLVVDYLGVDSLGGAASQLSLSGIFREGGSVFFTATWSSESGSSAIADYLLVVSTQGEFAVFEGSFPGGTDWSLVGVYDLSHPLGINGWFKAGGDIIVATELGMIPISAARFKDPAALSMDAISKNVHPDWVAEVLARRGRPFEIAKWHEKGFYYVNMPVVSASTPPITFVGNLQTGAMAKYEGWDNRCFVLNDGQMYFGCNDGTVRTAEVTGYDYPLMPYTYQIAMAWDHCGVPGFLKTVRQAKAQFLTTRPFNILLSASTDFLQQFPNPPNVLADTSVSSLWDVGRWDQAVWDDGETQVPLTTRWQSIGRTGEIFSLEIQIPIGSDNTPNAELTLLLFTSESGGLVV
jgi:hypothetical protein